MISPTEALILSLLCSRPNRSYASELMHASNGKLKRGSIYTLLNRLETAGLVNTKEEPASEEYALPRTTYRITGAGIRARSEFAEWTGLALVGESG